MQIAVRKAKPSDLEQLLALQREFERDQRNIVAREDRKAADYLKPAPNRERTAAKWFRKWLHSKKARVLIAEVNSRPIGFSAAFIEKFEGLVQPTRYGFIGIVFVRRRYRGAGIGRLLVKETLQWLRQGKIEHVSLSVVLANKPARAIWSKLGFRDQWVFAWKRIG
jgi:GNAT superfamily N-acetyltransferase